MIQKGGKGKLVCVGRTRKYLVDFSQQIDAWRTDLGITVSTVILCIGGTFAEAPLTHDLIMDERAHTTCIIKTWFGTENSSSGKVPPGLSTPEQKQWNGYSCWKDPNSVQRPQRSAVWLSQDRNFLKYYFMVRRRAKHNYFPTAIAEQSPATMVRIIQPPLEKEEPLQNIYEACCEDYSSHLLDKTEFTLSQTSAMQVPWR